MSRGLALHFHIYFRGLSLLSGVFHKVELLKHLVFMLAPSVLPPLSGPLDMGGGVLCKPGWGRGKSVSREKIQKDLLRDLPLDKRAKPLYTIFRGDKT